MDQTIKVPRKRQQKIKFSPEEEKPNIKRPRPKSIKDTIAEKENDINASGKKGSRKRSGEPTTNTPKKSKKNSTINSPSPSVEGSTAEEKPTEVQQANSNKTEVCSNLPPFLAAFLEANQRSAAEWRAAQEAEYVKGLQYKVKDLECDINIYKALLNNQQNKIDEQALKIQQLEEELNKNKVV